MTRKQDAEILLADSDPVTAALVRRALRNLGFTRLSHVADGYAALATLKKTSCALLIADWNLPKLDGFRVIEEIRRIPSFRCPGIIVMTGQVTRETLELAVDLGIQEYLLKPFTAKALREKVENVLEIQMRD